MVIMAQRVQAGTGHLNAGFWLGTNVAVWHLMHPTVRRLVSLGGGLYT